MFRPLFTHYQDTADLEKLRRVKTDFVPNTRSQLPLQRFLDSQICGFLFVIVTNVIVFT